MKKIILSVAAIFAFGVVSAQEEVKGNGNGFAKGNMFVSGAVSIGSEKTGDVKSTGFEIEPRFGYFVSDNIAIGAKLGFASVKGENSGVDTQDDTALTLGAFGRYYMTPASQFSLFAELGVDYTSIDDKLVDAQEKELGLGLGLGLSYFVSNNFAIEATWAGLGYTSNDNGGNGAEKTNSFGLGLDMRSIGFGMIYKF